MGESTKPLDGRGARRFIVELGRGERLLVSSAKIEDVERLSSLTKAERAVVELAVQDRSNAEIARLRGASLNTVANQLKSAYRKLGCNSRAEVAALLWLGTATGSKP